MKLKSEACRKIRTRMDLQSRRNRLFSPLNASSHRPRWLPMGRKSKLRLKSTVSMVFPCKCHPSGRKLPTIQRDRVPVAAHPQLRASDRRTVVTSSHQAGVVDTVPQSTQSRTANCLRTLPKTSLKRSSRSTRANSQSTQ